MSDGEPVPEPEADGDGSKGWRQVLRWPWQTISAVVAPVIALVAVWFTWAGNADMREIAARQSYEAFVDTRIAQCTALSATYATQSWAYSEDQGTPDSDLAEYARAAIAVARALRLCRNDHSEVSALKACVAKYVDAVDGEDGHFVEDEDGEGNTYSNLIC